MSEVVLAQTAANESGRPAGGYCGHCGEELSAPHRRCEAQLELEPPRYCPECRRRLIVQVLPTGYLARCSAHGELAAPDAA
ncbi:hypothetical protein KDL01_18415 [Actinospica durhamensis]|uniref:Biotin synthase auxiliary protein n=1 Tax=Actinospica durhamensis TaxID=1508375 RepID=A0A941EUF0_9ACTN|nr:hypothetical protein [Actinospica durhamensis]MBR7835254.1 hypothetical protein [Actinospica durhamensis]